MNDKTKESGEEGDAVELSAHVVLNGSSDVETAIPSDPLEVDLLNSSADEAETAVALPSAEIPDEALRDGAPTEIDALPPSPAEEGLPESSERFFYINEARALAARQPERAASMWAEAAAVGETAGLPTSQVLADLDEALALRPDSSWLVRRTRRLSMRLEAYDRALKLGQMEIKLGGETSNRAAVLVEGAAVVRYRLNNAKTALRLIEQALQLRPRYVPALAWAVALRTEIGQHADAAAALEDLGECLTDPTQRALFLYSAGTIREMRLNAIDESQAAYLRAAEADPQNIPVQLALAELYSTTEQWQPLCHALEHLSDLLENPQDKARLLLQAGTLHLDRLGNLDAASRDLSRAVRAVPENAAALQRLVYAYEAKGASRDMAVALRQLLPLMPDKPSRAANLSQIAALHVGLQEVDQAIAAYREALEQIEGYLPALQALGTIYRQRSDYERLVAILAPEAEGPLPSAARAVRYVELAEILAQQLNRPEAAVSAYARALELTPELRLAFWGQASLLRTLDAWEQLTELLGQQAASSADPRTRNHLLLERARLQAGLLGVPHAAIETLLTIDEEQGARNRALALLDLYAQTKRFVELVALLLEQAEITTDPHEAEGRRLCAAQILEFELEEHEEALKLYRSVLESNPASYAAIHGAGRILHAMGSWNDLIKLHHHELVTNPDRPDASIILCRVGRIMTEKLGNRTGAIKAYSKALRQDPSCSPALVALEGLVRTEKRWAELVDVLRRYASAQGDDSAAATALCRAGDVACWQLSDLDGASALFEQALTRLPGQELALSGLLQVRLRQRSWAAAVSCIDALIEHTASPAQRAALLLEQARLKELRLGEPPDLSLYRRAAEGPFGSRLREELLRVQRLAGASTPNASEMAQHLADLGRKTADDALGAAYLLEAAHLRELTGEAGLGAETLADASEAYRRKPDDLAVVWAVERALLRQHEWRALAELCEREAQLELDRTMRVQRLASAAEAYARDGALDEASRVCRECLNFDAHCLPALRLLARLAESQAQWRQLAELCDRLAEACGDGGNRLSACLRAAEIWTTKVGEPSRALASLAVALADDPGQPVAFSRAEALLRERRDFEELSRLYQRRIRASSKDVSRVELLRQHAELLGTELARPDRAVAELNALLEIAPTDIAALASLAELHGRLNHWTDAAAAQGLIIERASDAELRHRARLEQAAIWLHRLREPRRARAVLEEASREQPTDLEVKKLMVNLSMNVGEWNDARKQLEQILSSPLSDTRMWGLLRTVEVAQVGLQDDAQAESTLKEAVRLAAADSSALKTLREHFPASEEKARLVDLAQQLAEDARTPPEERPALLELTARLLVEDVGQPARAISYLEKLEGGDPGRVTTLLAHALERQGSAEKAAQRYRALVDINPSEIEAYRGLVRTADPEIAASAATFVELWGEAGPEEAVQLKTLDVERGPRGRLSADDLTIEAVHAPLVELMQLVNPLLEEIIQRKSPMPLATSHPASAMAKQLAQAFGVEDVRLETGSQRDARTGAAPRVGWPPVLLLAEDLVARPEHPAFRFWVARALAAASQGGGVVDQLSDAMLGHLIAALYEKKPAAAEALRLKKALAIPRKVRKQIESIAPPRVQGHLWSGFRAAINRRADRIGIVLSRHPAAALHEIARSSGVEISAIGRTEVLFPLIGFALSDEYARLYKRLWS